MNQKCCLWLIGGTGESRILAKAIASLEIPCIVTVTTEAAQNLYPVNTVNFQIWIGKLDYNKVSWFLEKYKIGGILDASHPHAAEVSKLAIASSHQYQIPYLRYERPLINKPDLSSNILHLDSFDTLIAGNYLVEHRVMLTLGYRTLPKFQVCQNRGILFARILPSIVSLQTALNCGFTPDRIIAMRPPISIALETALWQQWNISLVVTKASGQAGGESIKRQVAATLNIPLIIIDRPSITYPQSTDDIETAINFCRQYIPNIKP